MSKKKSWLEKMANAQKGKARRKIAGATGVPTTRAGRKAKLERTVGRAALGRGCVLAVATIVLLSLAAIAAAEEPPLAVVEFKAAKDAFGKAIPPVAPAKKISSNDAHKMEVGQTVDVSKCPTLVSSVLGKDSAVIRCSVTNFRNPGASDVYFVVKGTPTAGWVDGKLVDIKGPYKVSGTQKADGATRLVLEPAKEVAAETEAIEKAFNDAKARFEKAKKSRDLEAAREWNKDRQAAIAAATKDNPIPSDGSAQDRVVAASSRDKAIASAIKSVRQKIKERFALEPSEADSILRP